MKTQQNYIKSLSIDKQSNETVSLFGNCLRQLQTQFLSGLGKLDKHKLTLEKVYNTNPEAKEYIEALEYFMGEIDNNHLTYYIWKNRGCSDNIKYIPHSFSLDKIKDNCVIAFTNHDDFIKQIEQEYIEDDISYTDMTGLVKSRSAEKKRDLIIVNHDLKLPKGAEVIDHSTIVNFFVKQNEYSDSQIKENINNLRQILYDLKNH